MQLWQWIAQLAGAKGVRDRDDRVAQRHPEGITGRAPINPEHEKKLTRTAQQLARQLRL